MKCNINKNTNLLIKLTDMMTTIVLPVLLSFACTFTFMTVTAGYASATTYYIDASGGDDRNDGLSEDHPWKTATWIGIPNYLKPGDTVLFKKGEVWHTKTVSIMSSGTETDPIVIDSYGDAPTPPLLDGTYQSSTISWEHVSENIFRTTAPAWPADPGLLIYNEKARPSIQTLKIASPVDFINPGDILLQRSPAYCTLEVTSVDTSNNYISGVTFQRGGNYWAANAQLEVIQLDQNGNEISPRKKIYISSNGGLFSEISGLTRLGDWYWNETEQALYLYSETAPDENSIFVAEDQMFGTDKRYGLMISQSNYVTIKNIDLNGFSVAAIYTNFCNGLRIENCNVNNTGYNSHKTAILLATTKNSIVRKCKVDNSLGNGIGLYCQSPDYSKYTSQDNIIENNNVLNAGSAGISLSVVSPTQADLITYNIIRFNTVEKANSITFDAGGIYCTGTGAGNQIISNIVRECGTPTLRSAGIMIDKPGQAPPDMVNATLIQDNLVEDNFFYGIAVAGIGHQILDNIVQFNSAGRINRGQIVFFIVNSNVGDCTVAGNIIRADENQTLFEMGLNGSSFEPNDIDGNFYEIISGTKIDRSYDAFEFNGTARVAFDAWKQTFCLGVQPPCRDINSSLNIFYDYDRDRDTDGKDLSFLCNNFDQEMLSDFANGFGSVY